MSDPRNGAEVLALIKPTRREESTELCLRPDLLDAWETANDTLITQRAKDETTGRLSSGVSATARTLAKKVTDLENEIRETAISFRFRAMSKDQWRTLCDNHPPRKGNELDQFGGYDRDAVLDAAVSLCLIDPAFDDASWADFLEVVNPAEWAELRNTVNAVNRSVVDAPKSVLASQILSSRGGSSK